MASDIQSSRGQDPQSELSKLQDELNRLFDVTGLGKPFLAYRERSFPLLNVVSKDRESILYAEVPGVDLKDLEITITGDTLTLKGVRKIEPKVPDEKFFRRERGAGPFGRSVELPHKVEVDKVEASLKDGILRIRLPKASDVLPRKIEVKV